MDGVGVHSGFTIVHMSEDRQYQGQLIAAIDAEIGVRRWSRRRLAELSGINAQTLDRVFLLRRDMSLQQLDAIATALSVTPEYLVMRAKEIVVGSPTRLSAPAIDTQGMTDPRSLIQELLDNPDRDAELVRRLDEQRSLVGDKSARAKRLESAIRTTRHNELVSALEALPPVGRGERAI